MSAICPLQLEMFLSKKFPLERYYCSVPVARGRHRDNSDDK